VVTEGAITLPAAKLHEIARSLPEAEVQFKLLDSNMIQIECERTRYKISGKPPEEFPKFPEIDASEGLDLPGRGLHEMIERVAFAITTEDPRYSLNGALVLIEKGTMTLVATDGHRLAFTSRKADVDPPGGEIKVIVPRKALGEVSKLSADLSADDRISFGKTGNHVFFEIGSHILTSTVLEGNFPRYENVMPESCGVEIPLATEELSSAVRRVSLLAADRLGRAVRFGLSSGKLELFSQTEMGEAKESLPVDYDGEEMQIGFNARYLLDFLGAVGTPSVHVGLNPKRPGDDGKKADPGDKPGQFRPEPSKGLDYRYIVMPMHL
jgi:DNA polymerase-3 subunit beta